MPRPLVLIAGLLLFAAPALALDLPTRKAGLWEIKMNFEGRNGTQVMKQCIDQATDKMMNNNFGGGTRLEGCSKQDMKNSGGTITIDSICKFGEATSTTHMVITGSFESDYTMELTSTREGGRPLPGAKPGAEKTQMTIAAKRLGAREAGQKPGDIKSNDRAERE